MATARAIANGNWSATSTWNGGVLPGNGDTVYANGFNVTINQDINIGGANNPIVNTGSLVSGQWYEIVNVGGQSWTTLGAASNTVGTVFQSSGTGTAGNLGTARALATLTTATNTAAGATVGGGVFTMSTIRAMTCDIRPGATTCLNVTATTGTLTLSGLRVISGSASGANGVNTTANTDIASCTFTGGSVAAIALNNAGTGAVNVSASCTFTGGSVSAAIALNNAGTGTVNVNASCTFTGGPNAQALNNASSTGTINVSASCTFTGGGNSQALINSNTGTVNVNAPCTFTGGNSAAAVAFNNASNGTVIVTNGTFTASAFSNAVLSASTSADVRLSGDFLDHWSGWKAVNSPRFRLGTAPTLGQTRYALAGTTDSYFTMFGSDFDTFGNPIAANVRSGVVYGGGNLTGTCAIPAAGSVSLGVPVDQGFGTAVLTPADVQSALTAQGLTTARAGNLDNLDAAVSSRLAPSGTLATVTNLTNAPASVTPSDIWSHSSRTLTSASGPTAAEIRQEIDANSAKLDVAVGTRLAGSAYTAPANSDVAAIKAKTDALPSDPADQSFLEAAIAGVTAPSAATVAAAVRTELSDELAKVAALNTERLANVATTAIVGHLISQANS
jgi:hypothetical protein